MRRFLLAASAPTFIGCGNVASTGGSANITGRNLAVVRAGLPEINQDLTLSGLSSSGFTYTLPAGSYTPGTYRVCSVHSDGQTLSHETFLNISSTPDPGTIMGTNVYAWYRSDSGVTQSGGVVSKWADKGANALDLTAAGTQQPAYSASSANFTGYPSITFDGVNDALSVTSAANLGSNTIFCYVIYKYVTNVASRIVVTALGAGTTQVRTNAGGNVVGRYTVVSSAEAVAITTPNTTTKYGVYAYTQGTGASTETIGANLANIAETTASGVLAQPASGTPQSLVVGASDSSGGSAANVEVVEVLFLNALPSTAQHLSLYKYFNFRYGLDVALSYTGALDVLTSTGTESRIGGGGFNATTTVQISLAGVLTSVTATYKNAGAVSLSGIPTQSSAQACDIVITNASSGESLVINNGITFTATKKPDTIAGRKLIAWGRGDKVTLNSGNVSAFTDLALLGNKFQQVTAADQPPQNAANTSFTNQPTAGFTGSPITTQTLSMVADAGTRDVTVVMMLKQTANTGTQTFFVAGDTLRTAAVTGLGKPAIRQISGGSPPQWAAAVTGSVVGIYFYNQWASAGVVNWGINVMARGGTWGTEVQALAQTATNIAYPIANTCLGSSGSSNYSLADIAEFMMFDGILTGGQLTDIATYLGRY